MFSLNFMFKVVMSRSKHFICMLFQLAQNKTCTLFHFFPLNKLSQACTATIYLLLRYLLFCRSRRFVIFIVVVVFMLSIWRWFCWKILSNEVSSLRRYFRTRYCSIKYGSEMQQSVIRGLTFWRVVPDICKSGDVVTIIKIPLWCSQTVY